MVGVIMSAEEKDKSSSNVDDAQLEWEIRQGRKFSWAEAIARRAGKNLLKGASPITNQQQAVEAIERYIEQYLPDAEGALRIVLERRVSESEDLFKLSYRQPLVALAQYVEHLLHTEGTLQDFVREVDAQWGRIYDERPHFQQPGTPPDTGDPYTIASVRAKLTRLLEKLHGD